MDFYDLAHAQQRLLHSLIRIKKSPVFVLGVFDGRKTRFDLEVKYLASGKNVTVALDDKVDLTPVSLGNVNYQGDSYFLSRAPVRKWKQGLDANNLVTRNYFHGYLNFQIDSPSLVDTINGVYPTAKQAMESLAKQRAKSVAFSRNFSIIGFGTIVYNNKEEVGLLRRNDFELFDKYFFLKEMLQEELDR